MTTRFSQNPHDTPLKRLVSVLSYSRRYALPMKISLCLLLPILALSAAPALADEHNEKNEQHERADMNEAIRRGEIMTLSDILEKVKPLIDGRIVEIEFEREDGMPIYEIYILNDDGRRLEYEIDARTAEILSLGEED
ncbi:PepSY domain-containing protein [Hoeflea sp. G2-23]|uniref:PepSY domain-containing protein n=1 Tax=Hoeflea algicola TaxID=2983763 RepID=A0ABT3Z6V4_9HYPH|nr:PepSY domain-containing protein [Hoeflea algicola]MCY0147500.1 PepSY domain-containing protein [Hoeflea algicola]